ncbi:MAG: hypothetical protein QN198_03860 [Armatimonadota bacterium]|nr:hypothetical protein [Armatimonadota bacterium]MDR5702717.1 hypothetical protein [Armatimonadota bacterium]MDR7434857.1 hypothetical protein [Armatimonadota bacterium]
MMDQDRVRDLAQSLGLEIPEDDREVVATQLSAILQRIAIVEQLVGDEEPAFVPGIEEIFR